MFIFEFFNFIDFIAFAINFKSRKCKKKTHIYLLQKKSQKLLNIYQSKRRSKMYNPDSDHL